MKHKLQTFLKHKLQWLVLLTALLGVSQGVWGYTMVKGKAITVEGDWGSISTTTSDNNHYTATFYVAKKNSDDKKYWMKLKQDGKWYSNGGYWFTSSETGGAEVWHDAQGGNDFLVTTNVSGATSGYVKVEASIYVEYSSKSQYWITQTGVSSITANTPTVSGSDPRTAGETYTVSTTAASGGSGSSYQYQFYINNSAVGTKSTSRTYSWTPASAGTYSIKVRVYDPNISGYSEYSSATSVTISSACSLPSTITASPTSSPSALTLVQQSTTAEGYQQPTSVVYSGVSLTTSGGSGYTTSWTSTPGSATINTSSPFSVTAPSVTFTQEGKYTLKATASCSSTNKNSSTALITVKPGPLYLGGPFICGTANTWDTGIDAMSRTVDGDNIIYTFVWESKWSSTDAATNSKGLFAVRSRKNSGGGNIVGNYADVTLNGGLTDPTEGGNHLLKSNGLTYAVGDVLKLTVTFTGYGDGPSYTPQYTMKLEKVCTKPTAVSIGGTTPISFAANSASVGTQLTASTTPTDSGHDTYVYSWSATSQMSGTAPTYSASSAIYNPTVTFYREGSYTIQAGARCPDVSEFTPTAETGTKSIVVNPNKLYLSGPLYAANWTLFVEMPNQGSFTYVKEWSANTSKSGDDQKYFTVTRTQTKESADITVNKYAYISTITGITQIGGDYNYLTPSFTVSSGDKLRLKVVYTGDTNGSTPNKKPVYTFSLEKLSGGTISGETTVCSGAEFSLSLGSATTTEVSRIWQKSTYSNGVWSVYENIGGATGTSLPNITQTQKTKYRVETITSSGQTTLYSNEFTVDITPNASVDGVGFTATSATICVNGTSTVSLTGTPVLGGGEASWSASGIGISFNTSTHVLTANSGSASTTPTITYTITGGCGTSPLSVSGTPVAIGGVTIVRTPSTVHGYEVTTLSASPAKDVTWHIQIKPGSITTNQAYFVKDDGKATASDVCASSIIFKGKGTSGGGNSYTVRATDGTCTTDETFSVINDATESCN